MRLALVGFAYATWLVASEIIFYLAGGGVTSALQYAALLGVIPMALQIGLLGFDPVGLALPGKLSIIFLLLVLVSYLFNGADWSVVNFFIEAVYICVLSLLIAGCPDRRLLRTMAAMFSVMGGVFLVYIDLTGEYVYGRLSANGLEANFWGLMGVGVVVTALALPSRLLTVIFIGVGYMTMYDASSRSSIVAIVAAGLVVGCLHLRNLRNRQLVMAVGATAAALALLVVFIPYLREAVPAALDNVMKINDPYRGLGEGFSGRDILWQDAFNLWLKSPLFGVGFRLHERFLPFHSSTHNAYLAMLADMGIFGLLWYLALLVGAGLAAFSISDAKTRDLAIAMIVSYAVVGLFERRAVNAGNPVSILFMVTCFFSLTQRDLMRVRRRMAETRGTDPSLDGAEQTYALQAAPEPGVLPVMEHRHRR